MDIVCKASNMGCDVRCAVCGQSFLVYWTYLSPAQRARQHADVLEVLLAHHDAGRDEHVHPREKFAVAVADYSPVSPMMPPSPATNSGAHSIAA